MRKRGSDDGLWLSNYQFLNMSMCPSMEKPFRTITNPLPGFALGFLAAVWGHERSTHLFLRGGKPAVTLQVWRFCNSCQKHVLHGIMKRDNELCLKGACIRQPEWAQKCVYRCICVCVFACMYIRAATPSRWNAIKDLHAIARISSVKYFWSLRKAS